MDNSSSKILNEVKFIRNTLSSDSRGLFSKLYKKEIIAGFQVSEVFYSHSVKDTIRGVHLQKKPNELKKIITCIEGEILDFFIDLRKGSKTYGVYDSIQLSDKTTSVYIPKGFGHGFSVLSPTAIVMYIQDGDYNSEYEIGINPLSFEFNWKVENPIISNRDSILPASSSLRIESD